MTAAATGQGWRKYVSAMTPCIHLPSLVDTDCKLSGAGTIAFHGCARLWPVSASDHGPDDAPLECLFSEDLNKRYSSLQFLTLRETMKFIFRKSFFLNCK